MTPWEMYWLLKLDDINAGLWMVLVVLAVFSAIQAVIWGIAAGDGYSERDKAIAVAARLRALRSAIATFLLLWPTLLLPDTKQMAAIIVVPKLANAINENEKLKAIPNQLVDLASQWITELAPKEKKP